MNKGTATITDKSKTTAVSKSIHPPMSFGNPKKALINKITPKRMKK